MIITKEIFERMRSLKGGYSREILNAIGISWPLKKGWAKRAIGVEIPDDLFINDPLNPGRLMLRTERTHRHRQIIASRKEAGESVDCSYFIGALGTNKLKIGKTSRPIELRLAALQTACPHKLVVIATTPIKEKKLHKRFWNCRSACGEWFEWGESIVKFLFESGVSLNHEGFERFRKSCPNGECKHSVTALAARPLKYDNKRIDILKSVWKRVHG